MTKTNSPTLLDRFGTMEREACGLFRERADEVHGMLLAAISGQHILFLGPPGTAKSMLLRWMCDSLGGSYFTWLLTRFTEPSEIFGPLDLDALKGGRFKRVIDGKLPTANVALLEEIFKGSSAILNTILTTLQERTFYDDGKPIRVPLIFAAGASNELPEEGEGLEALYDRFMLRYHVAYLKDRRSFTDLISAPPSGLQVAPSITLDELEQVRAEARAIPLSADFAEALATLRDNLAREGVTLSDRRWVQSLSVLRAEAWLRGEAEVTPETLEVGSHIYWDKPEQSRLVRGACLQMASPQVYEATRILEAAQDALASLASSQNKETLGIQIVAQLRTLMGDLKRLGDHPRVVEIRGQVTNLQKQALSVGVGLDVSKL